MRMPFSSFIIFFKMIKALQVLRIHLLELEKVCTLRLNKLIFIFTSTIHSILWLYLHFMSFYAAHSVPITVFIVIEMWGKNENTFLKSKKKGSRTMPRFLHSIHCVLKRKNAIGESAAIGLPTWAQQQFVKFKQPRQHTRSRKCKTLPQTAKSFFLHSIQMPNVQTSVRVSLSLVLFSGEFERTTIEFFRNKWFFRWKQTKWL